MDIEVLRRAGWDVYQQIRNMRVRGEKPGERGAGGDLTYPVDKTAEDIIIGHLKSLNEPFSIISEEAGIFNINGGTGKTAVIDPIDGSRNASAGVPFYGTSIAVATGECIKDIKYGYIINLVNGDEFWAEKGKGAFMNGERVRTQDDEEMGLISFEAQTPSTDYNKILPVIRKGRKTRCLGAVALDLAYLASGAISVFVNAAHSRSFDYAAGYLLVKEAGGVFTDMEGRDIGEEKLGLKRGATLLASGNQALHEAALKYLNA